MFSVCANPECRTSFTYGQGRFFRFHKNSEAGQAPPNTHSVQHFWLCGRCDRQFTLELRDGTGVVIKIRPDIYCGEGSLRCIAAA